MKWTCDTRALEKINVVYSEMGFNQLCTMSDTHTRMLLSLQSLNFISADMRYDTLKDVYGPRIDSQEDIAFDGDFIEECDFSPLIE